jgi:hypothetical protein
MSTVHKTALCGALLVLFFASQSVHASNLQLLSDTVSTSIPGVGADHRIQFTLSNTVPSAGSIVVLPKENEFAIPEALSYKDIDLLVNGVQQTLVPLPGTGSAGVVGVMVFYNSPQHITFILHNSSTIDAGSVVTIIIGKQANFGELGTKQIRNPVDIGSYRVHVRSQDAFGNVIDKANTLIAIVQPVSVVAQDKEIIPEEVGVTEGSSFAPSAPTFTEISGDIMLTSAKKSVVKYNNDGSSIALSMPEGPISTPLSLSVTNISKSAIEPVASAPPGRSLVGNHVYSISARDEYGLQVDRFNAPLAITFTYTGVQVENFDEQTLQPYFFNELYNSWELIENSVVNTKDNTVSALVDHLTVFAIMGTPRVKKARIADFTVDKGVDLVDFSVLLYNWGIPKNPKVDMNQDGIVDLIDFSILLYWWTG